MSPSVEDRERARESKYRIAGPLLARIKRHHWRPELQLEILAQALAEAREQGRREALPKARFRGMKVMHSPHLPRGSVWFNSDDYRGIHLDASDVIAAVEAMMPETEEAP